MNSFTTFLAFALVAVTFAEPPSGYNYNRPQSSGGFSSGGGGFSSGGGGFSSGGGGSGFSSGGGGGYQSVPSGVQTSEGQYVDPQLLEQVRQILLREEGQSSSRGGGGGGGAGFSGGAPSGSYGPPSSSYGVPSYSSRVVGIDLEGVRQAIQVAQYSQISQQAGGSGGYPSGPSGGYPSGPSRPSGSYGAPF